MCCVCNACDGHRDGVHYRSVGRTFDLAGCDYVPQGNVMPQQEILLCGNIRGNFLIECSREHPPEPVLRMPVKEAVLPGLHRRKAAEDQCSAILVHHGREGVLNMQPLVLQNHLPELGLESFRAIKGAVFAVMVEA